MTLKNVRFISETFSDIILQVKIYYILLGEQGYLFLKIDKKRYAKIFGEFIHIKLNLRRKEELLLITVKNHVI